ncbi:MAG: fibronectin type III domain-containing protein, partial [Paludibacteraceae bacterium]|nr:fibronectin type III domain-containing protein [Paludibacteraceae bacterium]
LCSLVAVAQTDFKIDVKKQRADDMMEFTFYYNGVNRNTTFEVFKYENEAEPEKPSIKFSTLERLPDGVEAENFYKMEDGNFVLDPNTKQLVCIYEFTGNESYSCYLDGLDLTGSTGYKIAIKATITDGNDKIKEETIFIREANGQFTGNATPEASQNDATKYKFKYGLPDIPVLSDGKSTSVKLSWTSNCLFPEPGTKPDFYTIYGYKTENGEITHLNIATTTDTEYLITHLVPSVDYQFFVRAYKDGAYLSTSPNSNVYTPVRTECLTFTDIIVSNNKETVTLTILEYGDGFDDSVNAYELSNGTNTATCTKNDKGRFTFQFNSEVDYTKEFRLETKIKKAEGEVKAVGVFELDNEGKLSTQHCDIEIGLEVTKTTQYVAELSWDNPGFDVKTAILEVINLDNSKSKTITLENPSVTKFSVGNLEHSTNYKFVLTLEDGEGYNTTRDEVTTKTKVGSICGLEGVTSASSIGCGDNGFLAPYDVEFYTEYENDKPKVTVRFRLNSADEISSVNLYYAPDGGFFTTILNIKSLKMEKMSDGWYSASFEKLSGVDNMDGRRFYFSVALTPAKRCGNWPLNFYLTKSVAYQVGTGCQDEEIYKIIEFEKTYDAQSQLTLQTTGSMASVGVFPESGYNKTTGFDLKQRLYYNNFNDAPSKFTLDISNYAVGKYYMHIHDVYGEADGLKYLWAIY